MFRYDRRMCAQTSDRNECGHSTTNYPGSNTMETTTVKEGGMLNHHESMKVKSGLKAGKRSEVRDSHDRYAN
jgi:hypothetical protein